MPGLGARNRARRPAVPARRATELVRQAMASEDVEHLGLRADHVLGDIRAAAALLGAPDASPAARAAVVQRFGRVGALLVIGYEDRWRHAQRRDHGAATLDPVPTEGARAIETLVRDFPSMDAERVYDELCKIDRDELPVGRDTGVDAHRWLDATYAVAARDGTTSAHRAYMCALDRVMRLVRPLVAS
jgi:hypothetical protein